ncbi:hypothetical protein RRG08_058487 [Elysia crispata]|uniref:Uncharacterized protein n=1 Tax=Elysia crispata TaxID=231223 RepID=A0AAE0Y645_9GAST|nr:hypothetical protein RRG08_058487 [Elysia crispata]
MSATGGQKQLLSPKLDIWGFGGTDSWTLKSKRRDEDKLTKMEIERKILGRRVAHLGGLCHFGPCYLLHVVAIIPSLDNPQSIMTPGSPQY